MLLKSSLIKHEHGWLSLEFKFTFSSVGLFYSDAINHEMQLIFKRVSFVSVSLCPNISTQHVKHISAVLQNKLPHKILIKIMSQGNSFIWEWKFPTRNVCMHERLVSSKHDLTLSVVWLGRSHFNFFLNPLPKLNHYSRKYFHIPLQYE